MTPVAGMRFGRYELLARVGAGGMGEVWRARDLDLHRDVAVKFLPERFAGDTVRLGRFAQEARAASQLNHPNIVTIHEIGEISGLPFIVMEHVEGQTLREISKQTRCLPARRLLDIGTQLADGLAKAHEAGIVHRDLKPDNVMVTRDGFVKILDFGLAKLRSDDEAPLQQWFDSGVPTWPDSPSPRTAAGAVLGTVGYMSPEQARGLPVDHRSDQFALGAMLYEMAAGRQAFRRDTPAQTMAAIIEAPPEPLATLAPQMPPPLRWLVERCLAKDPAERYASTLDLARELRNVRERLPEVSSGSSPGGVAVSAVRPPSPRLVAVGVAVAILAVAFGAFELWRRLAPASAEKPPVVAVLPLTNLTGDQGEDATAVGIAEVVVGALTQIKGVQVLSRSATLPYRDRKQDLAGIARDLDASYLLDGVLQRSQNDLRVSLSLVHTPTRVVAWSATYDGAFPALFDLQSRAAAGVAQALRRSLSPGTAPAAPIASPEAWHDYALALRLLDAADRPANVDEAIRLLEATVKSTPSFARGHAALGRACLAQYDHTSDPTWAERARDEMTEALRLDPQDSEVRDALARLYMDTGRIPEALEEVRRALETRPQEDNLHRLMAQLLVETGDLEGGIREAHRAVALREWYQNYHTLGYVLYRAGRFLESATAFRRVTELRPDDAWGFQMLGTALHQAGQVSEAEAAYRKAIAADPSAAAGAWTNLGALFYETGRMAPAAEAFRKAIELKPDAGLMHRNLGDALSREGQADAARSEWKQGATLSAVALRVNPKAISELTNAAICQAKLGERTAAFHTLATALEVAPADIASLYAAAVVHALVGDPGTGLSYLQQALEKGASATRAAKDDDLANLRALPGYAALAARFAPRKGG
jgi:tetratricopeptide (TPR) repeat protein